MMSRQDDHWCCDLAGTIVADYKLLQYVGKGKIGYVYRAERTELPGHEWAIKLIFDDPRPGWDVELRKVMRLNLVPGVVHFHGLGPAQINHNDHSRMAQFTVWDYIPPGENLRQFLSRKNKIDASFLCAVVNRILHVLQAVEEYGVKHHGDLHAGNILIGDGTTATLDDSLERRAPIFVSDFGYGATGATKTPKDDYIGLANIINKMLSHLDYTKASSTDRQILRAMQNDLRKLLNEQNLSERRQPLELLRILNDIKQKAQNENVPLSDHLPDVDTNQKPLTGKPSVGQFQVSEMLGDRWDWWQRLFVPTLPARSKILAVDIPTVVTGPRGCGKTMLFRRLSERLIVECGEVDGLDDLEHFVALYVNANDFADAFAHFPKKPNADDESRLICYANLCILADLLSILSARAGRKNERAPDALLTQVKQWLEGDSSSVLVDGQDRLEQCRTALEEIKWKFLAGNTGESFPGYIELSQRRWLPYLAKQATRFCKWMAERSVLIFIDDYSTPRVSVSMQRVLNRLFFQRSPDFLAKVATEAITTFTPEDSSGKNLQDGDDYQLVDIGEESLFLSEDERLLFLNEVFSRRLPIDPRIPISTDSLEALLGRMPLSKTEFARRLRGTIDSRPNSELPKIKGDSQRRGPSRARVHYCGENVFSGLWSGDTRTMIQLISDVVDQASRINQDNGAENQISLPVRDEDQDLVFRNRGGEWLDSHSRNQPTAPNRVKQGLKLLQKTDPDYQLIGEYGNHLKAVVEAFVISARHLLLGPPYTLKESGRSREVPRMAFRIEITDEFRISGLAHEIYRDLIRYGLFMRDNRGKSVRGAFVPRLFLRRLLIPFCTLALSKRDSVQLTGSSFTELLLYPDKFKTHFSPRRRESSVSADQIIMPFISSEKPDPAYDDISPKNNNEEREE